MPIHDSKENVSKLKECGWKFIAVTNVGSSSKMKEWRSKNLSGVFGEGVFVDVICLDCGSDKTSELMKLMKPNRIWIEDNIKGAMAGLSCGLNTVILDKPHNKNADPNIRRIKDWNSMYSFITTK